MNSDSKQAILERLSHAPIYKEYERAFAEATGLPLTLSAVEEWQPASPDRRRKGSLCAILAKQDKGCAACLRTRQELAGTAREQAQTVTCFAGLAESAIPLRLGGETIGFLRTGEVLLHAPTPRNFARVLQQLQELGVKVEVEPLQEAYFHTRVLSAKQYESVLQLLGIFAQHLSMISNQLVVQGESAEPLAMTRARECIAANYTEELTLGMVAKAAHMSPFYFCKQFKKATGVTFTDYLGRVRVEKAKERLLNPNVRVSEVAFEVGFQSLTHFNRVFRKLTGESPSAYRFTPVLAHAA